MKVAWAAPTAALLACTLLMPEAIAGDRYRYRYDDRDDYERFQYRKISAPAPSRDTNSCIEGSVIGGLVGAGLGAALSRGSGRWVGVPLGGAAGALVGCQVDGG